METLRTAIQIVLGEDHAIVREGTQRMLSEQPDLNVVGSSGDGREVLELIQRLQPDVAVLDLRMPGLNGIELTRQVRTLSPTTRVLLLSAYDDDEFVLAAMEAGAAGYLLKTVRASELVHGIRAVQRGEVVLQPEISRKIAGMWARQGRPRGNDPREILSPRELQVLSFVVRGLRNKDIAAQLGVSVRTVEVHLSAILAKLEVASRAEAMAFAASHHWFPLDDGNETP